MKWMRRELAAGLAQLSALNLSGRPAALDVTAVAQVWLDSLQRRRSDWTEQLDTGRLRQGFAHLIDHAEQWPNPRDLMNVLPPRPEPRQKLLPTPRLTPEQLAENRRKLAEILQQFFKNKEMPK